MTIIEKILTFLDGYKTYIASIATVTIPFLILKGVIDPDTGAYIGTIIAILVSGGKIATDQVLGKANR